MTATPQEIRTALEIARGHGGQEGAVVSDAVRDDAAAIQQARAVKRAYGVFKRATKRGDGSEATGALANLRSVLAGSVRECRR